MVDGATKLLGVIGDPIEHSLSPVMHNAAIAELGLNYVYLPFHIAAADLGTAVAGFAAIQVQGFNITIPHKQSIMTFLDNITPVAQAIGAVNTVWWNGDGWSGTNTDVIGFLAPLQKLERDWSQTTAIVLGCGGAARAVVAGCAQLGCGAIQVIGRDAAKLQKFAASWQDNSFARTLSVHEWTQLSTLLPQGNLVVNATPVGMFPMVQASPLSAEELAKLPEQAVVYDLIYTPRPTRLLKLAVEQGAIAIDGLEMLVQQGAAALAKWTNRDDVPTATMRQVLQQKLRH